LQITNVQNATLPAGGKCLYRLRRPRECLLRLQGETTPASYRIDLMRPDDSLDFAAIDLERYGSMTTGKLAVARGSRTLRRFTPVLGEIPVAFDADTLRSTARDAAQDILHQFGIPSTSVIR
jgi:hypothetical protein